MRELRLLERSDDDGAALVLTGVEDDERFRLPIGDDLRDALGLPTPASDHAEDVATPAADTSARPTAPVVADPVAADPVLADPVPAAPVLAVDLSPREIQVRVRAGESPDELAASCGVAVERVMRFAEPVMAERLRIADEARRARARRTSSETDAHTVVFGDAVDARFEAHGITATEVSWNSYRREDGEWVIVAEWLGGESRHDAEWLFHRSTRTVTPVDPTAVDLLSDRPIRPIVPPTPVSTLRSAPPLAPGVVAFPSLSDAHTSPMPAVIEHVDDGDDEVFDQAVFEDGPVGDEPPSQASQATEAPVAQEPPTSDATVPAAQPTGPPTATPDRADDAPSLASPVQAAHPAHAAQAPQPAHPAHAAPRRARRHGEGGSDDGERRRPQNDRRNRRARRDQATNRRSAPAHAATNRTKETSAPSAGSTGSAGSTPATADTAVEHPRAGSAHSSPPPQETSLFDDALLPLSIVGEPAPSVWSASVASLDVGDAVESRPIPEAPDADAMPIRPGTAAATSVESPSEHLSEEQAEDAAAAADHARIAAQITAAPARALRAVTPLADDTPTAPLPTDSLPAAPPAASRPADEVSARPAAAVLRPAAVASGRRRPEDGSGARGGRVSVPSWDDILLGVRRKDD